MVAKHYKQQAGLGLNTPNIQLTQCIIHQGSRRATIACVYRSPSATEAENTQLLEVLDQMCTGAELLLLVGDFNAPGVEWESHTASDAGFSSRLLRLAQTHLLTQHVTESTRYREGQLSSRLDLVFTKGPQDIRKLELGTPLGRSDHTPLTFEFALRWEPAPAKWGRNLRRLDPIRLSEDAQAMHWPDCNTEEDLEGAWSAIKQNLLQLLDSHAPLVRLRQRGRPPWWRARAQKAHKRKQRAWLAFRRTGGHRKHAHYIRERQRASRIQHQCRMAYEARLAQRVKDNPKAFYSYAQTKPSLRKEVGSLTSDTGEVLLSDQQKADHLATFFSTVHRVDRGDSPVVFYPPSDLPCCMNDFNLEETEVEGLLKSLVSNKAPGPDGIPPLLLKILAGVVARPLTSLLNVSISKGKLVTEWRGAHVVALHKGGPREAAGNYRPVSLTSIPLKICEKAIRNRLARYLTENRLLNANQHGFIKRKSCLSNLICFLDEISRRLDRGEHVEVCYLDFSKAFDSVNQRLLMAKLERYKVAPVALRWISDFLSERSFRVTVGVGVSESHPILSGVPQGSVLGPLLFLVYINDLAEDLSGSCYMFADDVKLVGNPLSMDLQEDLHKVARWAQVWDLPLNVDKCAHLVQCQGEAPERVITSGETQHSIQQVTSARDLGVTLRSDLKPRDHVTHAVRKGWAALQQLTRAVKARVPEVFLPLYKAMVRPHLEYCAPAWRPHLQKDIRALERVQRVATRRIKGMRGLSYPERLAALNLYSLERRRLRGDLIETFKVLKGFTDIPADKLFSPRRVPHLRGHSWSLDKPRARTTTRAKSFAHRVVDAWNSLPEAVVACENVQTFKLSLDRCWHAVAPDLP